MICRQITVPLFPRTVFTILIMVAVGLSALSLAVQAFRQFTEYRNAYGLIDKFNVSMENNIPTFFSTLLLLICSVLLLLITRCQGPLHRGDTIRWGILALGFFYLACDEAASLHELLIHPVRGLLGSHWPAAFRYA